MNKSVIIAQDLNYMEVDKTHYPVIIFSNKPVTATDSEIEAFLNLQLALIHEAKGKLVYIYDINQSKMMSSKQRIHIAKWSKENDEILNKNVNSCIVNSSVLMTLMIKGIMIINKSIQQTKIFKTVPEALEWSKEYI